MNGRKKVVTAIMVIIASIAIIGSCYLKIQYICENVRPIYYIEIKAGSSNATKE